VRLVGILIVAGPNHCVLDNEPIRLRLIPEIRAAVAVKTTLEAPMPVPRIDAEQYQWIRIHDDSSPLYTVDHEQTVLGYDRDAGTFDMILRFSGNNGHCNRHRHVTTTSVLVLEGEQHLTDLLPGGDTRQKVRLAGEHHLTTGDIHPHMERGGDDGALIFYGHHTSDGKMYELLDDDLNVIHVVTIDEMIEQWENSQAQSLDQ
jgi:hypothetical protein